MAIEVDTEGVVMMLLAVEVDIAEEAVVTGMIEEEEVLRTGEKQVKTRLLELRAIAEEEAVIEDGEEKILGKESSCIQIL